MPQSFFAICFFVMLLAVGVNFVYAIRLFSLLRKEHYSVWVGLGEPSLFLNNSIRNNFRLMGFLFRREYLRVGDANLTKLCNVLLLAQIVGLGLFAILFIAGNLFGVTK